MKRILFILLLMPIFVFSAGPESWTPGAYTLLQPTERKPARTLVLVMSQPDEMLDLKIYTDCRRLLTKKIWRQYMNSHPNVDCYFLQNAKLREGSSELVWIEGDTIYVVDGSYEYYGVLVDRTALALEKLLPNYTHVFRTNISAFVNLKLLNEYAETHHQSMFTGPLWQGFGYPPGYGVLFTADVAAHIVKEYQRLKDSLMLSFKLESPEDLLLMSLATGIYPYYEHIRHKKGDPKFSCCPTLPPGVQQYMCGASFSTTRLSLYGVLLYPAPSFDEAIYYCNANLSTAILYRIRSCFDMDKLAAIYEFLLDKIYPELPKFDFVEYAKTFPHFADNS